MERKKWYAIVSLVSGAVLFAIILAPYAEAHDTLKPLTASAIFAHANKALRTDAFGETLTYDNALFPPEVNMARFVNMPIPDSNVTTINLYQNSPTSWRFEEMSQGDNIVGVVARVRNQLVTYQGGTNERTKSALSPGFRSLWSLWAIPDATGWQSAWAAQVSTTTLGDLPTYRVTLRPKSSGTLWGRITYWFQGRYFIPVGVKITDRGGSTVFLAQATVFTDGAPGASANPPTAGELVSWKPSSGITHLTHILSEPPGMATSLNFPSHLGPLTRVSDHQVGTSAIAVYGNGPGQVMVLSTIARVWKGQKLSSFLRPVTGSSSYQGVTDGVFSVVTCRKGNREVALMGSRTQQQLMQWARFSWR